MIGWPSPAPAVLMHAMAYGLVFQLGADPDMVEPAALVGHAPVMRPVTRSEEHTSELQSRSDLVCRLLLEKKKKKKKKKNKKRI